MLKKLLNEAYFTLRITTTGPLLIRSGRATIIGPDMTPVLTFRNNQQEIFLPGSSLKGVFRSHSEKVVCSLKSRVVCYPFAGEDKGVDLTARRGDYRDSCGAVFTELGREDRAKIDEDTEFVYANSCPACRLFGSTGFIGRIAIGDAYLAPGSKPFTEQRDGVGIDRLTGGASHGAKFELEVVSADVSFETNIHVRNFEIWQLGMLFIVLQDLEDELIRIGSGRSRGLGQVKAQISEQEHGGRPGGFVVSSIRNDTAPGEFNEPLDELWGLGRWLNDGSYGTQKDDRITLQSSVAESQRGIRNVRAFSGEALDELRKASTRQFAERMLNWPEPKVPLFLKSR